jgi:hypothetical protein
MPIKDPLRKDEIDSMKGVSQSNWIFDKTNRPASHPRGVHDKTDYEVAL